jgi:hypothetical protein
MPVKDPHDSDFARFRLIKDDVLLDIDFTAAREHIIAKLAPTADERGGVPIVWQWHVDRLRFAPLPKCAACRAGYSQYHFRPFGYVG